MRYRIGFDEHFFKDIEKHRKSGQHSIIAKIEALKNDICEHPRIGIGQPEALGYDRKGQWSRRITERHRLIYEIHDNVVTVIMISAYGHYGDK